MSEHRKKFNTDISNCYFSSLYHFSFIVSVAMENSQHGVFSSLLVWFSLVPRPSVALVFDRLQYAKTGTHWLSFCILQAIKNHSHGRPGNEASMVDFTTRGSPAQELINSSHKAFLQPQCKYLV